MATIHDSTLAKRAALSLLRKGLASQAEAARLARVSRQLVRYWLLDMDLDVDAVRAGRLARLWHREMSRRKPRS